MENPEENCHYTCSSCYDNKYGACLSCKSKNAINILGYCTCEKGY